MTSDLVNIDLIISDMVLDLRYKRANNITGFALYGPNFKAKLSKSAAGSFKKAALEFSKQGFKLVVWDAFRPIEAQKKLQVACDDTRYVATDSNHCKGLAVDVTLANTDSEYLDMGTDHDEFSEKSHADYGGLTKSQKQNRLKLKQTMGKYGFAQDKFEWWHFDYIGEALNV